MKSIISDKTWREYWDELMEKAKDGVPWGTIVEEKPKHSNLTTEEESEAHKTKKSKRRFKSTQK
jgi:hypothetical protein